VPEGQQKRSSHHKLLVGGLVAVVLAVLLSLALVMAVALMPVLFFGDLLSAGQVTSSGQIVGGAGATATSPGPPVNLGPVRAPANIVTLDKQVSAGVSCHVSASLLLAQQFVESTYNPSAVGPATAYGHAEGMAQFLPSTFAEYDHPVPPGGANPPSPYNAVDAAWAEARMLCSDGIATNPVKALYAYNHSYSYGTEILQLAVKIAGGPPKQVHL
jgi:hypothetical protein